MTFDFKRIQEIFFPDKIIVSGTFGLDIGAFSVKAVEIKKNWPNKQARLAFAVTDVSEEGSKEAIITAIKQSVKAAGIGSKRANLSFSGANIITRYMLMPKMPQRDLISSLEFELVKHIPTKLEDMVIDYQVLDKALDNQMLILVVGAERRIIAERIELVKQAGFAVRSVNVDCFAISEVFQRFNRPLSKDNGCVALLDIGHRVSKLAVLEGNLLRFSRDIILGGYDLTKAVSERMNTDLKSAEALKRSIKDKSDELSSIAGLSLNGILDELRLSFDYCERMTQKKITRLYLSGGGARLKDIDGFFASGLEIEVSFWNPLDNFQLSASSSKEEIEAKSSLLATAIGLAFK